MPQFDLNADPGYQAALSMQQMGQSQSDAALKSEREQAVIQYGDPALADLAGFGLDPQAAAFARQNYLTGNATLARLDKSHDLQRQAVINALAGTGLLNSGDLGYREGQADQVYGNSKYDAQQAILQALTGYQHDWANQRQGLQSTLIQAIQQAYANKIAEIGQNAGYYNNPGGPMKTVTNSSVNAPVTRVSVPKARPSTAIQKVLTGRRSGL